MRNILLLGIVLLFPLALRADDHKIAQLTANELADALGVHWWVIEIPSDLGPKDSVGISFVSSDGKEVAGGTSVSPGPGNIKLGQSVKVFCWEDKAAGHMIVKLESDGSIGTVDAQDYLAGSSAGPASGSVLKPGDILLKFDSANQSSFTGGNGLSPGQIGLKVVIKRG